MGFSVTPVPENKERKVSFSPDIDESYRHHVVDKIKNLMDEVQTIHEKEEKHLEKQPQETWRLFGKASEPSRPTISNLWDQKSSAPSSRSSPWSPQSSSSASSPTWDKHSPWTQGNAGEKNKSEALTYWNSNQ